MAFKKRSGRMYVKRKRIYKKKRSLKRQILRLHEQKERPYELSQPMMHNTYYQFSPTQQITNGTNSEHRIGDDIYLMSLELNGFFYTSTASGATQKMRCMVFWSEVEEPADTLVANAVTGTQIFHLGTFVPPVNGIVNKNACTMLADFVVDASQVLSGVTEFKSFSISVPLNQTYKYKAVGNTYGKYKQLYVTFISHVAFGTDGSTSAGGVVCSSVVKFKDP